MSAPDGVQLLVPAGWDVPGAQPIPMTPNKDLSEGRLQPFPADLLDIVKSGVEPPNALFQAQGATTAGGTTGLVVGVYDIGGPDPLERVREAVLQAHPEATLTATTVAKAAGLEVRLPATGTTDADTVVREYWARVKDAPGSVLLIRIWRNGPGTPEDEAVYNNIVGSCVLMHPWSELDVRAARNLYAPPTADEPSSQGRWRFAGWRLGTVFHTKMVPPDQLAILTAAGASRRDTLVALAVFVAWVGLALAMIGFETPIFLVGGLSFAGTALSLRSQGLRAVVALAVILAVLLGIGLVA